jgi:hypothetical protein
VNSSCGSPPGLWRQQCCRSCSRCARKSTCSGA